MDIADHSKRLTNYFIDKFVYILLIIANAFFLDGYLQVIPKEGSPWLVFYAFILYFSYYFLLEYYFGKTIGKMMTITKVVNKVGEKPDAKMIFIRTICRFIPFNNLSFLFLKNGWHDKLSKTYVVNLK